VFAGEADDSEYKQGADYCERLDDRIEEVNLTGRVTYLGWCDDVPALLDQSDLFVLPSYDEGLPRSIIEAFSIGVLVVATLAGGTTALVTDGTEGLIVPIYSPDYLAEALRWVGTGEAFREGPGRAARHTVEEDFSVESYVSTFERYIDRVGDAEWATARGPRKNRGLRSLGSGVLEVSKRSEREKQM